MAPSRPTSPTSSPNSASTVAPSSRPKPHATSRAQTAEHAATPTNQAAVVDAASAVTRPVALECNFETICERCGFFETGPQFVTILRRQRDHATGNDQHDRAQLFTGLLDDIDDIDDTS